MITERNLREGAQLMQGSGEGLTLVHPGNKNKLGARALRSAVARTDSAGCWVPINPVTEAIGRL